MSRRSLHIHPLRLAFWTAAVLAMLAMLIDQRPFELDAGDPQLEGRRMEVVGRGDMAVLMAASTLTPAPVADEVPGAWSWVDMINQEVGPVSAFDVETLDPDALLPFRYVVFTRSACEWAQSESLLPVIEQLLARGTSVVLELPTGALRSTYAADGAGGWRTPGAVTALDGTVSEQAQQLRRLPLLVPFTGNTRPPEGTQTLMAFDGAPVIYVREYGNADLVVLEFDLGRQLMRLQQGVPREDFTVRPRSSGRRVITSDMVASPAMLDTDVPWADLLERYVVHRVLGRRFGVLAFWQWPAAQAGALLTSHQTRSLQGRPLWMSIHERSLDARSATFVAAPASVSDSLPDDAEHVGHAALLWNADPSEHGLFRSWNVGPFTLLVQPITLVSQLENLEESLGEGADIRGVRMTDSRWSETWTGAYRAMDAVELRYSVTYGAAAGSRGYLFGTCQPFTPRDTSGLPFRVQEVPVCFVDPVNEEEVEQLDSALRKAASDHYTVHLLTSADRFQYSPSMAGFDAWRNALETARQQQLWIGGAGEYVTFLRRRQEAELRVRGREVTSRDSDGTPRVIEYTVDVETANDSLAVMLPARSEGLRLSRVSRGNQESQFLGDEVQTRETTWLGEPVQLVPLNAGFTTLGLRYSR
jgi:hypothetical protein